MKKTFRLVVLLPVVTLGIGLSACGDDDSNGSPNNNVVDGVSVVTGKKIKEIKILDYIRGKSTSVNNINTTFKIDYDSKGRLSKVIRSDVSIYSADGNIETRDFEYLSVDYDLRVAQIAEGYLSYMFMLNNKGCISQIGNCSCNYDEFGYLSGAETGNEVLTLAYSDGELIKSSVNNMAKGNIQLYYIYTGEDSNSGELYFTMNAPNKRGYSDVEGIGGIRSLLCFIAYQSGLFGKISKNCAVISNTSTATFAKVLDQSEYNLTVHCSFKFE